MEKEFVVNINGVIFIMSREDYHRLLKEYQGDVRHKIWGVPTSNNRKSFDQVKEIIEGWFK